MVRGWTSWGRLYEVATPPVRFQRARLTAFFSGHQDLLPIGCKRSYGDICLLTEGQSVSMCNQDHFLSWDQQSGILKVQAGVTLADVLAFCVPRGWFLPVTPGTKYVSVGGAIANDIHGKNHHQVGTFGRFVRAFSLLRSDGEVLLCAPDQEAGLFSATIGGLGLTGFLLWAEIQMIPIQSSYMRVKATQFVGLDAFFELGQQAQSPYTVAWIDTLSRCSGRAKIRGVFLEGHHGRVSDGPLSIHGTSNWKVPCAPSFSLLNRNTVRIFNSAFYHKQISERREWVQHYDPFFYPLDGVENWNRFYGKRGLYQFQCVVPLHQVQVLQTLLDKVAESRDVSFLSVLKVFGALQSPGMLSFPQEGVTLCLDFPNRGVSTRILMSQLTDMVIAVGGRLYPAKDATMSGRAFKQFYPEWESFLVYKDPLINSDFWKRMMHV